MNQVFKIIFSFFLVCFLGYFAFLAKAGTGENTTGFAWSENIGWVSFNSTSDGSSVSYGVQIDPATGNLSGYAWSENIGWISFNRADTGNPPQDPFMNGAGNDPIAKNDLVNGNLTGWMRVLANGGGWDGWIRFCDSTMPNCSGAYQIAKIDSSATGDWHGWAWSDMVVGWLSFNSVEGGGSAYKVSSQINVAPNKPTDLNASSINYCLQSPNNIILSWQFTDINPYDTQSSYQAQVKRLNDSQTYDSNKFLSSVSSITAQKINSDMGSNFIWYDPSEQGYDWRVKVWDSKNAESVWSDWAHFDTVIHQYPSVNFNPIPANPSIKEETLLDNLSFCINNFNDPIPCPADAWLWTIPADATYEEETSFSSQEPIVIFNSTGENPVTLQVTDADSNSCTLTKIINVGIKLPWWKEILPW